MRGRILGSPKGPRTTELDGWLPGAPQLGSGAESRLRHLQELEKHKTVWGPANCRGLLMGSMLDGDARKSKEEGMDGR